MDRQIKITSAEMAQLWAQYMNDSGCICLLRFFLEKAEDEEVRPLIEYALQLSTTHIQKLTPLFKNEGIKVPFGFCIEEDVDLTSPKLYSDTFVLHFIHQMSMVGLTLYASSVAVSVREDITDYYMECLTETMELYKLTKELLLLKGLYVRSPIIEYMEKNEFVKKQGFMLDIFGEKRPLVVSEINNLYSNIQRNVLGAATLIGFSQVAKDKNVNQFLIKGIEIAKKQITLFGEKLAESNLPAPMSIEAEITNSTSYTFSNKLMMFFTSGLISLSVGFYGTGIGQSPRADLVAMYNRLSLEVQLYSEDGANIMIKNGWLEQQPMATDREELAAFTANETRKEF